MAAGGRLGTREAERGALLARIGAALRGDGRVVAAWLGGSLGRGTADAWSDLDLWVTVDDAHLEAVTAERTAAVAAVGEPILALEAPHNAPAGGAYLLVLYAGDGGPQQVDWYWQPRSSAERPAGTRVLFDRAGVPVGPEPAPLAAEERGRLLGEKVAGFWVAVSLAGKAVARGQGSAAIGLTGWAATGLAEVRWLVERGTPPEHDEVKGERRGEAWSVPGDAAGSLAVLRRLCRAMEGLGPAVVALGGHVPTDAAAQTRRFIEIVAEEGEGADG